MNSFAIVLSFIFLVLVIFIMFTTHWTVAWPNWKSEPKAALSDLVQQIGPPSFMDGRPGGMTRWDNPPPSSPWGEISQASVWTLTTHWY